MTPEIGIVLALLFLAMVLLAMEMLAIELVAFLLVAALAATGILSAQVAFQGFASETVVMLACVMVLSHRLTSSGLIAKGTRLVLDGRKTGQRATSAILLSVSALLSSFITNTSTTAILIPAARDLSARTKTHPGRYLMPMAFASMMGGSTTLIGTSTNLAASGALAQLGLAPFSMFEFAPVGVVISVVGIAFLVLFGRWLLPDLPKDPAQPAAGTGDFMTTLTVPMASKYIGMTIRELPIADLIPLAVRRASGRYQPHPLRKIEGADRIIVSGPREAILAAQNEVGGQTDVAGQEVAEAILMPGAGWIGQSLGDMTAQLPGDARVLALHRRGQNAPAFIRRMILKAGDVVLVSATPEDIAELQRRPELSFIGRQSPVPPTQTEGRWTLLVFLLAIAVGTSGLMPLSVALLSAVLALVLAGRVSVQACFAMVNWRVLILIGGMSSFGVAMLTSGTANWLAGQLLGVLGGHDPRVLLLGLGVLTVLLTQPLSNAAAALTLLPVAIEMADLVGADPRPFVVMVTLSASLSFIAPFEPALLLVYGQGNYRFRDFPRAGTPLTILSLALLVILVPMLWPLGI